MIKTLLKCVREYKRPALLTPVCVGVEVLAETLITYFMARLIDLGIEAGNMRYILLMGGALILCSGLALAFGVMSARYAATASSGFSKNLRQDMYHNIQDFSFTNIDKFSTASLITRLTTDTTYVQMAFMVLIRIAVRSPLMLVFSIVMAFSISPELAMIFVGMVPVLGIGLYLITSKAFPIFERVFKKFDVLNRVVQENLAGVRVVKAFVREDHEIDKFETASDDIYRDFTKAEKIVALNNPLMQFCLYACLILASWLGAKLIIGGNLTTGGLMSIITYSTMILMSLMMLSMVFVMITIARAPAERITEVLKETSSVQNPECGISEVKNGDIEFKNADFSYSADASRPCLAGINLHILSGETIGVIGGTGSGKSSLVQLIPRLYDVTNGEVTVGGVNVKEYDLSALRDSVAMVLQKNTLFSGSIADNLRWGNANATDEDMKRACRIAQAEEFINDFPDGYDTHIEQGGTNVSGGQRQRLCIARALLKNPKILILDDSTSAVDVATDARIRRAFREELPGVSKIIIAQRINSVQDADRIIVMENGAVNGFGTHSELLESNKIYREVYNSQQRGGGDFDD